MLPNFLLIGTQKAGTSWLAKCLGEHPDVFMAEKKEIHFFNHQFERGLNWYEYHFSDWSGEAIIGEATPGYINHSYAPARIQETLGDEVKIIASLRHPVDRAYSAFWQYVTQGRIPADVDFRTFFSRGNQFGLHSRGDYYIHLKRYSAYFAQKNFLILIYEEMQTDHLKAIKNCFAFLGVDTQVTPKSLEVKVNKGIDQRMFHSQALAFRSYVVEKTNLLPPSLRELALVIGRFVFNDFILRLLPSQNRYLPLAPEVRYELLKDFMPDIKRLEDFLNKDLSIWYGSP